MNRSSPSAVFPPSVAADTRTGERGHYGRLFRRRWRLRRPDGESTEGQGCVCGGGWAPLSRREHALTQWCRRCVDPRRPRVARAWPAAATGPGGEEGEGVLAEATAGPPPPPPPPKDHQCRPTSRLEANKGNKGTRVGREAGNGRRERVAVARPAGRLAALCRDRWEAGNWGNT